MAMRNFWLTADIDGKQTRVATGPQAAEGGMSIKLFVRDEGTSQKALTIDCFADSNGELTIELSGINTTRCSVMQPGHIVLKYQR